MRFFPSHGASSSVEAPRNAWVSAMNLAVISSASFRSPPNAVAFLRRTQASHEAMARLTMTANTTKDVISLHWLADPETIARRVHQFDLATPRLGMGMSLELVSNRIDVRHPHERQTVRWCITVVLG